MMRKHGKTDNCQQDIVLELRRAGASVLVMSSLGGGAPDICVGYGGKTVLMELKSSNGKLTPDERAFFEEWRGAAYVVASPAEALGVLLQDITERDI